MTYRSNDNRMSNQLDDYRKNTLYNKTYNKIGYLQRFKDQIHTVETGFSSEFLFIFTFFFRFNLIYFIRRFDKKKNFAHTV